MVARRGINCRSRPGRKLPIDQPFVIRPSSFIRHSDFGLRHSFPMPVEFDLISWIRSQHPPTERVPVPQGADLAVLKWDASDLLLVGVDQVLDTVHFDSAVHSPRLIGRKVMNRNLSDCAAMACLPAAAVVTAALPRGTSMEYAQELHPWLNEAEAASRRHCDGVRTT